MCAYLLVFVRVLCVTCRRCRCMHACIWCACVRVCMCASVFVRVSVCLWCVCVFVYIILPNIIIGCLLAYVYLFVCVCVFDFVCVFV